MFEGEVAYDYGINFDELYLNVARGSLAAIERTSIGVTQGLFGPKVSLAADFGPCHRKSRLHRFPLQFKPLSL